MPACVRVENHRSDQNAESHNAHRIVLRPDQMYQGKGRRTAVRGLAAPASDAPIPKTLLDPEMTDIPPSPMGDAVESADERVAVISENRKRRLAPRANRAAISAPKVAETSVDPLSSSLSYLRINGLLALAFWS